MLEDAQPLLESCETPFAGGRSDDEILRFAHRLRATNGPPPERAAGAA